MRLPRVSAQRWIVERAEPADANLGLPCQLRCELKWKEGASIRYCRLWKPLQDREETRLARISGQTDEECDDH